MSNALAALLHFNASAHDPGNNACEENVKPENSAIVSWTIKFEVGARLQLPNRSYRESQMRTSPLLKKRLLASLIASSTLSIAFTPLPLWAQSSNANLRGSAPANTAITAEEINTGATRGTHSDAQGNYSLIGLPPGTYKVTAGSALPQLVTLSVASTATLDLHTAPSLSSPTRGRDSAQGAREPTQGGTVDQSKTDQKKNGARPRTRNGSSSKPKPTELQTVVVTGAQTYEGVTRARASFGITDVSSEQMKDINAQTTSQVLQLSPGIIVQPAGGASGSNVILNGFPSQAGEPFVTYEVEGMPRYSAFNSPVRINPAISGVEILQGGPSVVTGAGQFGVTANFRLRRGTTTPAGELGVTGYSEGGQRISGFYGFPVTKSGSWVGSVGGYWRNSDGVRDPHYTANKDVGFTATLEHDFDSGSLLFYWMYNREYNEWTADYPLLNPSKGNFASFPGFDALTDTVYSRDSQYLPIQVAPCSFPGCNPRTHLLNTANGREANSRTFGINFNVRFNDVLSLSNGFQFTSANQGWEVFFNTGPNPQPLSAFIAQAEANWHLPNNLTPSAMYTTGGVVPLDTLVMEQNPNYNMLHHIEAADQLKLNINLSRADTLTVGTYINIGKTTNPSISSFNLLENVKNRPTPITLALSGGGNVYQVTDTYGLFSNWNPSDRSNAFNRQHLSSYNFFAVNVWKQGPWMIQTGARFSRNLTGAVNVDSIIGDLDGNPYTLYNNTGTYLANKPAYKLNHYAKNTSQFSAGVSYLIHPNWSVYGRVATAAIPPTASSFRDLPEVQTERIHMEEVGMKYANSWLAVYASAYRRMFYNQPSGLAVAQNGAIIAYTAGADAKGINLSGDIGPFDGFSMRYNASYVDGHYTGHPGCVSYPTVDGNIKCESPLDKQLQQQPRVMYRLMPTYSHPTSWGGLRIWLGFQHTGNRYSDQLEQVPLGSMSQVNIGVEARVHDHWIFTLRGRNVTDEFGVNEGNLRIFGGATTNHVTYGRTVEGHEYNLQARYMFGD